MRVFPQSSFLSAVSVLAAFALPVAGQECLRMEPAAAGWSAVNAHALVVASGLAYEADAEKLRSGVQARLGMTDVERFSWSLPAVAGQGEGGLQGFLAGSDEVILLIFRGTEQNVADLLTDLWFRPVALKEKLKTEAPGKVHEGFATALAGVWPDLKTKLDAMRLRHPKAVIWAGGHSMGGALALTAAAALSQPAGAYPLQGVTVFGAPVTGEPEFCEGLSKALPGRVHRCVCSFDLVGEDLLSRVPVPWQSWQYQVPGQLVYFDARGGVHTALDKWLLVKESMRFAKDLGIEFSSLKSEKGAREALTRLAPKLAARHSIGETYEPALRRHAAAGGKLPGQ